MSVYGGSRAEHFRDALESVLEQTYMPRELVVVLDGPIGEDLVRVLEETTEGRGAVVVRTVPLEENRGLGQALQAGMRVCDGEWVVRMDADDISAPRRFEVLAEYIEGHPDADVVTSWATVEAEENGRFLYTRSTPETHEAILRLGRFRYPLNHPACVMRKSVVLAAGGYQPFEGLEDYHLFARLVMHGARFGAVREEVYRLRGGTRQVARRHGLTRARQQVRLQRYFVEIGYLPLATAARNVIVRTLWSIVPSRLALQARVVLGV